MYSQYNYTTSLNQPEIPKRKPKFRFEQFPSEHGDHLLMLRIVKVTPDQSPLLPFNIIKELKIENQQQDNQKLSEKSSFKLIPNIVSQQNQIISETISECDKPKVQADQKLTLNLIKESKANLESKQQIKQIKQKIDQNVIEYFDYTKKLKKPAYLEHDFALNISCLNLTGNGQFHPRKILMRQMPWQADDQPKYFTNKVTNQNTMTLNSIQHTNSLNSLQRLSEDEEQQKKQVVDSKINRDGQYFFNIDQEMRTIKYKQKIEKKRKKKLAEIQRDLKKLNQQKELLNKSVDNENFANSREDLETSPMTPREGIDNESCGKINLFNINECQKKQRYHSPSKKQKNMSNPYFKPFQGEINKSPLKGRKVEIKESTSNTSSYSSSVLSQKSVVRSEDDSPQRRKMIRSPQKGFRLNQMPGSPQSLQGVEKQRKVDQLLEESAQVDQQIAEQIEQIKIIREQVRLVLLEGRKTVDFYQEQQTDFHKRMNAVTSKLLNGEGGTNNLNVQSASLAMQNQTRSIDDIKSKQVDKQQPNKSSLSQANFESHPNLQNQGQPLKVQTKLTVNQGLINPENLAPEDEKKEKITEQLKTKYHLTQKYIQYLKMHKERIGKQIQTVVKEINKSNVRSSKQFKFSRNNSTENILDKTFKTSIKKISQKRNSLLRKDLQLGVEKVLRKDQQNNVSLPSIRIKSKIKNITTKKISQITEIKNNYHPDLAKKLTSQKIEQNHKRNQEKMQESRTSLVKNKKYESQKLQYSNTDQKKDNKYLQKISPQKNSIYRQVDSYSKRINSTIEKQTKKIDVNKVHEKTDRNFWSSNYENMPDTNSAAKRTSEKKYSNYLSERPGLQFSQSILNKTAVPLFDDYAQPNSFSFLYPPQRQMHSQINVVNIGEKMNSIEQSVEHARKPQREMNLTKQTKSAKCIPQGLINVDINEQIRQKMSALCKQSMSSLNLSKFDRQDDGRGKMNQLQQVFQKCGLYRKIN